MKCGYDAVTTDCPCSEKQVKCRCPHNTMVECSRDNVVLGDGIDTDCCQDGFTNLESTCVVIKTRLAEEVKCTQDDVINRGSVLYEDVASIECPHDDENCRFHDVTTIKCPQDDVTVMKYPHDDVITMEDDNDLGGNNPCDDVTTTVRHPCSEEEEEELPLTYRSGMYAHWWLKTHLPSTAASDQPLRQRSHTDFGEQ